MCNYGEHVLKIGFREGILISIKNLIDSTNMTPEQAMTALKIPKEDRKLYSSKLSSPVHG